MSPTLDPAKYQWPCLPKVCPFSSCALRNKFGYNKKPCQAYVMKSKRDLLEVSITDYLSLSIISNYPKTTRSSQQSVKSLRRAPNFEFTAPWKMLIDCTNAAIATESSPKLSPDCCNFYPVYFPHA